MSLADILASRIRATGPLTIADYMVECLLHPTHGYYTNRDPLGAKGDFTTAPEISQMFGELIGLCLAQTWLDQGAPAPFILVELGPGRGTLMADALRATAKVPGFHAAAQLHLVEASPALRQRQLETISHPLTHHDTFATVPEGPLLLIANEFFDALPIRQFQRDGTGWRERVVGLENDKLTLGLADQTNPGFLESRKEDTDDGDIVEICPTLTSLTQDIAQRIARHGGAALLIDYGDWHSLGDTLQAVQSHETASPFDHPGEADLTAHVDFAAIAKAASPAKFSRVTPQGIFLERLGITPRAQALAQKLNGHALDAHVAAHRRLTHADEMGTLFKVLALYPPDVLPPPGLDP